MSPNHPPILYIGNFKHEHCTEQAFAHGFEAHGYRVIALQQEDAHHGGPPLVRALVDKHHPFLVLYTRTHSLSTLGQDRAGPEGWARLWKELDRDDVATASVHLDVFRGLPKRDELVVNYDPMFTMGTVFTADGDPDSARWYANHGVHHRWLPPAYDHRTDIEWPIHDTTRRAIDSAGDKIVFVGSTAGYPHPHRRFLLDHLEVRWRAKFLAFGPHTGLGTVRGQPLDRLIKNARIVIGDSWGAGERARYWSDRVPETLGRGGNLLHTYDPTLVALFPPDICASYYTPFDLDNLDGWLAEMWDENPGARHDRQRRAREYVIANHTYIHRAHELIEQVIA